MKVRQKVTVEEADSSRQAVLRAVENIWDDDAIAAIKDRFVTGSWAADENAADVRL